MSGHCDGHDSPFCRHAFAEICPQSAATLRKAIEVTNTRVCRDRRPDGIVTGRRVAIYECVLAGGSMIDILIHA